MPWFQLHLGIFVRRLAHIVRNLQVSVALLGRFPVERQLQALSLGQLHSLQSHLSLDFVPFSSIFCTLQLHWLHNWCTLCLDRFAPSDFVSSQGCCQEPFASAPAFVLVPPTLCSESLDEILLGHPRGVCVQGLHLHIQIMIFVICAPLLAIHSLPLTLLVACLLLLPLLAPMTTSHCKSCVKIW